MKFVYVCSLDPRLKSPAYYYDFMYSWSNKALVINTYTRLDIIAIIRILISPLLGYRIIFGYSFYYRSSNILSHALKLLKYYSSNNIFMLENEYRLLPSKFKLASQLGCKILTTQYPIDTAKKLYQGHWPLQDIFEFPHCYHDSYIQLSKYLSNRRSLDLIFRGNAYPPYVSNAKRQFLLSQFADKCNSLNGFRCDISSSFLGREAWIDFLGSSRFTIASEAGGETVCFDDEYRKSVNSGQINLNSPDTYDLIPAYSISARHIEAIAIGTVLIMPVGRYNGILIPNDHYVPLNPSLDSPAIRQILDDESTRQHIAHSALLHIKNNHSFDIYFNLLVKYLVS